MIPPPWEPHAIDFADQFDHLGAQSFVDRMAAIIVEADPSAADEVRSDSFAKTVLAQVDKAKRYGLQNARHAATFVLSAWLLGLDFDEHLPAIQAALSNPGYTAHQKATFLEAFTTNLMAGLEAGSPNRKPAT